MLNRYSSSLSRIWQATLILACALVLTACGGGATDRNGYVPYTGTGFNTRALPAEFTARQAVNYSPYRTSNRDTETPTAANVLEDLNLLIAGKIRLIRLFDSSNKVAKLTLDVIKTYNLDMKVQLGIWINSVTSTDAHLSPAQNQAIIDAAKAANNAEIVRGVALAADYKEIILAVSVGNEMMVNWSAGMDPEVMAAYINTVRSQVTQPVTSDDDWSFWAQTMGNTHSPTPVLNAIDFVSMHSYPMAQTTYNQWDWRQANVAAASRAQAMMDAAMTKLKADYAAVRSNLDRHGRTDLPIIIGETGWRAANTSNPDMTFRASPVNQKMYFDGLAAWNRAAKLSGSGPANIFYFEAFDEPWKGGDDKWGLFTLVSNARKARCAVQDLSATYTAVGDSCASTAAVYWKAAVVQPVTASQQYTLYADDITTAPLASGTTPPTLGWWWGTPGEVTMTLWAGAAITQQENSDDSSVSASERAHYLRFVPDASTSWGWGGTLILNPIAPNLIEAMDLSQMRFLNFSVKTDYAGRLEVGFVTGRSTDSSAFEVFMQLASGQYGYVNNGAWHNVKIPVADIVAAASTGLVNGKNNFGNSPDLTQVTQPFVIADRYTHTGNTPYAINAINIDRIFWSAN